MWKILDKLSNHKLLGIHPVRCNQPLFFFFFFEVDQNSRKCGLDFERHHFETASCKLQNIFIPTLTLICNSRYPHYITQRRWRWSLNHSSWWWTVNPTVQSISSQQTMSLQVTVTPNPIPRIQLLDIRHITSHFWLRKDDSALRLRCGVPFLITGTPFHSEANSPQPVQIFSTPHGNVLARTGHYCPYWTKYSI